MTRDHALELLEAARSKRGKKLEPEPELELLEGRREEMYWENVPEKVRALAAQRVLAQTHQMGSGAKGVPGTRPGTNGDKVEDTLGGSRRRKRRR